MGINIEEHDWYDYDIVGSEVVDNNKLGIQLQEGVNDIWIKKEDAIAIARHFQLTTEDLRDDR